MLGVVSNCWAPLDLTLPKVWYKAHKIERHVEPAQSFQLLKEDGANL